MYLTPIKVRGKGAPATRRVSSQPPSKPGEDGDNESVTSAKKPIVKKAPIERLPLEILEQIFLDSSELNFPRSSLRIGYMLSSRSCLLRLVISVFAPTWSDSLGKSIRALPIYLWDSKRVPIDFAGDPKLQSDILACKWATMDIITGALQVWLLRNGRDYLCDHSETPPQADNIIIPAQSPSGHNAARAYKHATESLHECFEFSFRRFATLQSHFEFSTYGEVHPAIRIPDALLAGPFDLDMIKKLYWLSRSLIKVKGDQSWELAKEGLQNILEHEDDEQAALLIILFEDIGAWDDWPRSARFAARSLVNMNLERRRAANRDDPLFRRVLKLVMTVYGIGDYLSESQLDQLWTPHSYRHALLPVFRIMAPNDRRTPRPEVYRQYPVLLRRGLKQICDKYLKDT